MDDNDDQKKQNRIRRMEKQKGRRQKIQRNQQQQLLRQQQLERQRLEQQQLAAIHNNINNNNASRVTPSLTHTATRGQQHTSTETTTPSSVLRSYHNTSSNNETPSNNIPTNSSTTTSKPAAAESIPEQSTSKRQKSTHNNNVTFASSSGLGSPTNRPSTKLSVPPPTQKVYDDELDDTKPAAAANPLGSFDCSGITREHIRLSSIDEKEEVEKGFNHLVGNTFRYKGHVISNQGGWFFDKDIIGFILDNNRKKSDTASYTWKCVEKDVNVWAFHRHNCSNVKKSKNKIGPEVCQFCWEQWSNFTRMCKTEREVRKANDDEGDQVSNNITRGGISVSQCQFKSPTVVLPILESMSNSILILSQENMKLKSVVEMLENDKVEVVNLNADVLFDPDELKDLYTKLLDKKVITKTEIFNYLFQECVHVGKRIKAQGSAKGHVYSGLMIQFACMLRNQMNASMYDFFRKAFNLPAYQTLCQYNSADSTSPDGPMMQTIIQISDMFDKLEFPQGDWRRNVNLGWDSHVIKDLLGMFDRLYMYTCVVYILCTCCVYDILY